MTWSYHECPSDRWPENSYRLCEYKTVLISWKISSWPAWFVPVKVAEFNLERLNASRKQFSNQVQTAVVAWIILLFHIDNSICRASWFPQQKQTHCCMYACAVHMHAYVCTRRAQFIYVHTSARSLVVALLATCWKMTLGGNDVLLLPPSAVVWQKAYSLPNI